MARESVKSVVKRLREAVDSLGTPAEFRKPSLKPWNCKSMTDTISATR